MSTTPNSQGPVVSAVEQVTQDLRVRLAMIFGASYEGGLRGPWGTTPGGAEVGDNGSSFGPWQMHFGGALGPTPSTAAGRQAAATNAANPLWAAQHMLGEYSGAVKRVPNALWQTDPALAAEEAAAMAERPAKTYLANYGRSSVNSHYQQTLDALKGGGATGGPAGAYSTAPGTGTTGPGSIQAQDVGVVGTLTGGLGSGLLDALSGPAASLFGASGLQDLVERGALIVFGGILVIVGLIMLVKDTSAGQAAGKVAQKAGATAAMAAVAA